MAVTVRSKTDSPVSPAPTSQRTTSTTPAAQPETPAATGLRRWQVRDVPSRLTGATGFESRPSANTARANFLGQTNQVALTGPRTPAPGSYPTPSDVDRIAGLQDPVERNYQITQGYHDLGNALGDLMGRENANWSTFGVWASKQAGATIRQEDMPAFMVDALNNHEGVSRALENVNKVLRGVGLPTIPDVGSLMGRGDQLMDAMSDAIADGNQQVFAEIGREFSVFVETFKDAKSYDQAKVDEYLAHFTPEQAGLRDAFSNYARAMFEQDPNKKAELMLLGNAQIGLHEQTNLQVHIERALTAPEGIFRDMVKDAIRGAASKIPFGLGNKLVNALERSGALDRALSPLADKFGDAFRRGATEWMMKLTLPSGQELNLGEDLPVPASGSPFPKDLTTIENPELQRLLSQIDKSPNSLQGSGANDWAQLGDRMNYIVDLFRSNQTDPTLWQSPLGRNPRYSTSGVS